MFDTVSCMAFLYTKYFFMAVIPAIWAIPYHIPACWPLIFIAPSLLFYITTMRLTFMHYYAVSLSFFSLLLMAAFQALFAMAHGSLIIKLLPLGAIWLYAAIFPTMLLWISSRYSCSLTVWTLRYWFYLMVIDRLMFMPFGVIEGFFLANPMLLLPLRMQRLILFVPLSCMLLYFSLISSTITACLLYRTRHALMTFGVVIMPWLIFCCYNPPPPIFNAWLAEVKPLGLMIPKQHDQAMITALSYYLKGNHKPIVIMPESAWESDATILSTWSARPAHLIVGGFAERGACRANRLFWIHGDTVDYFDKRHALPLIERSILGWLDGCYYRCAKPTLPSLNERPLWRLNAHGAFVPYICSELFFNAYPDDPYCQAPILACCNDWWFSMPYFRELLVRAARLRAMQWSRPILFISYHGGVYFDVFGRLTNLD